MRPGVANERYLQRHIEAVLPEPPDTTSTWRQVLVIPAYREHASLVERLRSLHAGTDRLLIILVLNRPDTDPNGCANDELRRLVPPGRLVGLNDRCDLYTYDLEAARGPLPADKGVGLARKAGCDLAWKWRQLMRIDSDWLCNTDADATLPADYFSRLEKLPATNVAAVFPFRHSNSGDTETDLATAVYELRLHQYVLGLDYANSPYAFHAMGSCLAVRANAYAQVRGFPQRAGGEDFYLLNKVAKLGAVARLAGACIQLQSRISSRVPFGTGPAVRELTAVRDPLTREVFYPPAGFTALREVLNAVEKNCADTTGSLEKHLAHNLRDAALAQSSTAALHALGIEGALQHCHRQSQDAGQFQRQFHQWFDGFRTLKFIHHLRDHHQGMLSLRTLSAAVPAFWPTGVNASENVSSTLADIRNYWGWED